MLNKKEIDVDNLLKYGDMKMSFYINNFKLNSVKQSSLK